MSSTRGILTPPNAAGKLLVPSRDVIDGASNRPPPVVVMLKPARMSLIAPKLTVVVEDESPGLAIKREVRARPEWRSYVGDLLDMPSPEVERTILARGKVFLYLFGLLTPDKPKGGQPHYFPTPESFVRALLDMLVKYWDEPHRIKAHEFAGRMAVSEKTFRRRCNGMSEITGLDWSWERVIRPDFPDFLHNFLQTYPLLS